jgi:sphingolipid 8-(E)-desaturase
MALSTRFVENLYSSYYRTVLDFDMVAKFMVPMQHYTFYLIMAFGRFNLYVQSWAYVISTAHAVPNRTLEITCMTLYWVWHCYILSFLPSAWHIFGYVMLSHTMTFLLHTQICLSHFGMSTEVIPNETYAEKALRTTLDVECPRWMDWLHGGLQVSRFNSRY